MNTFPLLLRQDNADARLTPKGREAGLISDARWERFLAKQAMLEREIDRLEATHLGTGAEFQEFFDRKGTARPQNGTTLAALLRRPEITYADLDLFDKVDFISYAIGELALLNAEAVWGRAEELASRDAKMREKYDAAVGRAVAAMPVIMEYEAPFVRPGGHLFVMKGPRAENEPDWRPAAKALGLDLADRREFTLIPCEGTAGEALARQIYVFAKPGRLPERFPRRAGKAAKEPLV